MPTGVALIDPSVKSVFGNRVRPSPKSIRQKLRSLECVQSGQKVSYLVTPDEGRIVVLARKTKLIRAIANESFIPAFDRLDSFP